MCRSSFYRHYLGEVGVVEEILEDHKLLDTSPTHQAGPQVGVQYVQRRQLLSYSAALYTNYKHIQLLYTTKPVFENV